MYLWYSYYYGAQFVITVVPCKHGAIRLSGGSINQRGRVELCQNETWGTICASDWGNMEASVACRSLGFSPFGMFEVVMLLERCLLTCHSQSRCHPSDWCWDIAEQSMAHYCFSNRLLWHWVFTHWLWVRWWATTVWWITSCSHLPRYNPTLHICTTISS